MSIKAKQRLLDTHPGSTDERHRADLKKKLTQIDRKATRQPIGSRQSNKIKVIRR